ncbi:tetratricopeptide repeat protein [Catalinimonas niigatensis]|uniref:tetratricopeptide repeat protein n=1 Tax=Catalinimonas niigatensis TaxID=1397264 RepID=UPI002664EB8E|nr:ABC transporter substrate-binding protein [Catalinimonas niigatensis]WPP52450.1 ABC transporter substrate-binding protein [Catalinimonas niigatensis]
MLSFSVQAQTTQEGASLRDRYEQGKRLYEQRKYEQAIEIFRPLSRQEQSNPYVEYASYYFGLSALKSGQYDLAKNMFLQIISKHSKWDKLGEINYWLANTYFRMGDYNQAMGLVEEIKKSQLSTELKEDVAVMKEYFLEQATSEELKRMLKQYPTDMMVAEQLVKNMSVMLYDADERLLMDSLVQAFDIDMASLGAVSKEASVKKEAYQVAVLLPFLHKNLSPDARQQGNQFILDLYKGIKMAAEDLKQEGINVYVHAYDTERSGEKTHELLSRKEMELMDVFIGPLYADPIQEVTQYTREHQKYMFNPLSINPAVIGENPFSYLMRPSLITEGRRAAQFAIDSLGKNNAVVITSKSGQDSMRVSSFVKAFEEGGKRNAIILEEDNFNRERIGELVEMLNELGEDNLIYVASGKDLIISNTVSAVVMAEHKVPVIGSEEWLEVSTISYDQLEGFEEYLISPSYIDPSNEKFKDFKERYRKRFYEIPNKYTYVGYDLMAYIGNMLDRYGVYFQEFYTQKDKINSLFYSGYDYFNANDNQLVPIVKYEEAQLKQVDVRP